MRKLRDDDRGITLVELIVSIAILAIIVLPFLNSFVMAAKTNAKSKNELNATHLAENIMEGVEKNSMKTLAYQFNYPSEGFDIADGFAIGSSGAQELIASALGSGGTSYAPAVRFDDVDSGLSALEKENKITSSIHKTDKSQTINDATKWKFVESSSHKYYFYMSDVQSGSKKYNALVTLDARADEVKDASGKTDKANSGKVTNYNTDSLADISSMNFDHDAIWTDQRAFSDLKTELENDNVINKNSGLEESQVNRTITVKITNTTSTKVEVSTSYDVNGKTYHDPNSKKADEFKSIVFDNSSNTLDHDLRNIYIFYTPWYTSTGTNPNEQIVIENDDSVKCNVNLVKQMPKDTDPSALTALTNNEKEYTVGVNVLEKNNTHSSNPASVTIATNLDINLGRPDTAMSHKQALYKYNNEATEEAKNKITKRNLTNDVTADRIYDVTVDIFDSKTKLDEIGTAKPEVSITGSMVD